MPKHIAVIGTGWAGCAAAVELTSRGERVTLFDAARTPGGRARRVDFNGVALDNGQHILLGAYTETLRLMQEVGVDLSSALLRLPMQMRYPNRSGMDFVAASLPAPFHLLMGLLRASGLGMRDKFALASFAVFADKINWTIERDCTVAGLLQRFKQTNRIIQLMWRPLCLAALNTPPELACAQTFLNVLKDSLGADSTASQMLLPRQDLSALFPQKAIDYVIAQGGANVMGKRIQALKPSGSQWQLIDAGGTAINALFHQVVIATDIRSAIQLLEQLASATQCTPTHAAQMPSMSYQAITTCYLQYAPTTRLDAIFYALADDPNSNDWGQFVFDRGQLHSSQSGLFAVVISASEQAAALDHVDLTNAICAQLATVFKRRDLNRPLWTKVITEKRATFSCVAGLDRPTNTTSLDGIVLAGDYTIGRYPATLEAAVQSGIAAALSLRAN